MKWLYAILMIVAFLVKLAVDHARCRLRWHPWQEFEPEFPALPRRVCLVCHRRQRRIFFSKRNGDLIERWVPVV